MNNRLFTLPALLLLAVLALSSCSKVPSSARLIPKDASCVMRIDVKQIAEKAEGKGDGNLKQLLKDEIKDAGMSRQATDLLLAIIDKPKKLGIDLRDPVFAYYRDAQPKGWDSMFGDTEVMENEEEADDSISISPNDIDEETEATEMTDIDEDETNNLLEDLDFSDNQEDMEFGLIATIYDADDLENVIQTLRKELELKLLKADDNVRYMLFNNAVLVFNDDYLLYTTARNDETENAMLTRAQKQLKQEKSESLADNDFFKQMCKKDGDMQALFLGQAAASNPMYASMVLLFVSEECKLGDIASLIDCTMLDGETIINTEVLTSSKAWDKEIKKWSTIFDELDGDLCQYVDNDADMMMAMHVNGEKLVAQIESMPVIKALPGEMKKTIFPMLKSIQGDAMMGLRFDAKKSEIAGFSLYAHTKDGKLAKFIGNEILNGEAEQTGKDQYKLYNDSVKIDFGWKDGLLFCTSGEEVKPFVKAKTTFDTAQLKGKKTYARINFSIIDKIKSNPNENMKGEDLMILQLLSKFDRLEMYMEGERSSTLRLVNKDSKQNILSILSNFLKHLPEEFTEMVNDLPSEPNTDN